MEAGGKGAFVNHLIMNSPFLHGGFFTISLLLVHGLQKLYKKFILPWNEWAQINDQRGVLSVNAVELLGVRRLGRFGPYVIIPTLCVGVSLWQPHQLRPLCARTQWPIYSLPASHGPRNRNKLIHTSPRPIWLCLTHFKWTKKDVLLCWKSWEKLGCQGDGAVKAATGH